MFFFRLLVALEDEVNGGGVREFGGAAEAAVVDVEKLGDGFDLRFDDAEVEIGASTGKDFGLRDGVGQGVGGAFELAALVAVGIGDGQKNAAESGATHLVFGREIGAAKKGFAIGEQKSGERPAALAGNGADGGLIAGVDVGPLVAIDLHGDEMFVDDFGDLGVFVAFAVDDVAPVAPDRADVEEDGFVLGFGTGESGVAPFVPVDGLVCGGTQIRAGGIFQAVFAMVGQSRSQFELPGRAGTLRTRKTGHHTTITEWCRRGRGRAGRAVCGSRILRPGDGKNGCGPRRASSRDRHPVY